ncbi:hypothetical protein JDV02_003932 [Purpureocillium takamizusanense]|uniref:Zn(2)-C6 fungal-type domain-containing protein n=1 Tax=Purpureocillium takamizusanense TaxID=2060973 RepID=A0A9Q8V8X0_9HYPO|nr:uncharacterized protein JDV02_003932 [Purpureocillium takamizusanense]UNI17600.1 hypothetical protein JDV02_003932 [Purpureocillium takamizusanense]
MGSDSRPVCHRCAQIKQACDGSLPCARCVRLSLPCRPRNSVGAGGDGLEPHDADVPKARIRRVQTGCLMCKRRKKKCDEIKPRCGDCRRLCLDCAWPPERHSRSKVAAAAAAAAVAAPSKSTSSSSSSASSTTAAAASQHNGIDAAIPPSAAADGPLMEMPIRNSPSPVSTPASGRHGSYDSSSHGSSHGSHASSHGSSHPSQGSFSQPEQTPPGMAISAAAAAAAAAAMPMPVATTAAGMINGLALDMSPPGGGGKVSWDVGNSSPHGWIEAFTPVSNGSPAEESFDSTPMSSLSVYVPQLLPQLSAPQDKALLNHYSTIVSSILSRRASSTNPYNNYLLPMAQSNDLVLHCILALSANHWRKLQPGMGDRGLLHKSKATQALARLLPDVDRTSADIALVSSLLLCMTELFDGTSEGWKLHLKGAKRLLMTLREQQGDMMTGHYKFLLRLARFLDSAATTSTCRPPLIGEEEAEAAALDRMTAMPDEEDSAVYGIPKELFHLVDRVNTLADLRSTRVDRASEAAFRERAKEIEGRINHWSYEYGGMSRAVWSLTPANDDVLHATMAFEYAIRLRLHQIVEGYDLGDPKVGQFVDGILECVQKIRYGSPLETCLLYPLVMAGGSCWKLEHRVVIQDRLLVMERTCGFGYIYNARDLVERVWTKRDQVEGTGAIVNWARIRYYEMNGLVVF